MNQAPELGYEEWFHVRTHEIDPNKRMTVPDLLKLMQEASMHNAMALGISVWDLEKHNISWVILRKVLNVIRLPILGEKIKIVTYPAGFDRVFAYRDFWATDSEGKVIAHAASTWTLLNTVTRKLERIPKEMYQFSSPVGDAKLDLPKAKLVEPENYERSISYTIRQLDLDWNNHVNNGVLSKLMFQSIPKEFSDAYILEKFSFHIKSECFYEEELQIELSQNHEKELAHRIKGKDQKVVAIGRSVWK